MAEVTTPSTAQPVTHPATTIAELVTAVPTEYESIVALRDHQREILYRELPEAVFPIAKALMAHGIEAGDRIAIWAPNSIDWVLSALAIHVSGAILVPINTRMKGAEAAQVLSDAGCKGLFSCGEFLNTDYPNALAEHDLPELQSLILLPGQSSANPTSIQWQDFIDSQQQTSQPALETRVASVTPESTSDILFTSGTTGKPKGVLCTHGGTIRAFRQYCQTAGFRPNDRYLIVNPFFHAFGYKAGWVSALLAGCTIIPEPVFDAKAILTRIQDDKINILPGPPTLYTSLLADPDLNNLDISSLRIAVTGSSSVSPTLVERMREELACDRVMTAYGLTECGGLATICSPDDDAETVANTSGKPIPGTELAILNRENQAVENGEIGEICLRGFHIMQGYWQNPEATAQTIDQEGWLHTGDLGSLDKNGNLQITGRLKDMYICGGFNCYPAEIEAIMQKHPQLHEVAVIGVPEERMGEVGCAYVVTKQQVEIDQQDLIQWCRENMANYKVPRFIRHVTQLPVNASNKVLKPELLSSFLAEQG